MSRYIALPGDPVDLNRDGIVTLGELVKATVSLFSLIVLGLNVAAGATGALLKVQVLDLLHWLFGWWFWFSLVVSALATLCLGLWRLTRYERAERREETETRRRWEFEDRERALQFGVADQDTARITQTDIDSALWLMLVSYYERGVIARGKVPGVSDPRWNAANELLKKCGLRKGRKARIEADTLAEAWSRYIDWKRKRRSFRVEDGELLVK